MSNLVPFNLNTMAAPAGADTSMAAAFQDAVGKSVPTISFKGSRFHLRDATGARKITDGTTLDVVVVRVRSADNRAWWAKAFDSAGGEPSGPPTCSSNNGTTPTGPMEGRPLIKIANGSEVPTRSCAECPKHQAGSRGDGTDRRACGFHKKLVAYSPDDIGGQPYVIKLGALSYSDKLPAGTPGPRGFKNYCQFLLSHGITPAQVVTRLSFDTAQSVPAVRFAVATDSSANGIGLSPEGQAAASAAHHSPEVMALLDDDREDVPAVDTPITPALAAPVIAVAVAAAPVATVVAPPVIEPAAPATSPAESARYALVKLLEHLKGVNPEQYAAGAEWALHAETDVAEATEWVQALLPAPVKPVAPAKPTKPAAPTKPTKPAAPTKPAKPAAAAAEPAPAVTAKVSEEMQSMSALLGMDEDL